MHPDKAFGWHDRAEMRAFIEQIGLGALFAATPAGLRVAHVPVLFLADDRIGFHLSRHSPLATHLMDGEALFVAQGPHAYISPDWYGLEDQVPTWNYVAVELDGYATAMNREDLVVLIDAISKQHEAPLAPKREWTRDKMSPGLFERMLGGIVGYSFTIREWRGTMKIGRNKPETARLSVAAALAERGERDMAALMQGTF